MTVSLTRSTSRPSAPEADLDTYVATRFQAMASTSLGDPARDRLRDEVICGCLPIVRRLATRFGGRGEDRDDLIQIATIGLIKSVDRFDPSRGTPFLAYATPTIIGEIKRHFRDKGWVVKVSRPLQELHLEIARRLPDLAQRLGRTPRIADIAEYLNVTPDDVSRGLECGYAYSPKSLSAPAGDGTDRTLAETVGGADEQVEFVADRVTLRELVADLPERERDILGMRFFENLSQTEIAERIGVSQMHVSRLLTHTLSNLRDQLVTAE
jgi:RNA polymerase sigma-B factor